MFGKMLSVLYEISKAIKIKKQKDDEKIREYEERIAELNNNQQVQQLFLDNIFVVPDAIAIGETDSETGDTIYTVYSDINDAEIFQHINNEAYAICLYKNIDLTNEKGYIYYIRKYGIGFVIYNTIINNYTYTIKDFDQDDEYKYIELEERGQEEI